MKRRKKFNKVTFIVILVLLAGVIYYEYNILSSYSKSVQAVNTNSINTFAVANRSNSGEKNIENKFKKEKSDKVLQAAGVQDLGENPLNSYDAAQVYNIIQGNYKNDGHKIAFLTFDDGPSITVTPMVLNTLKHYGINATFFLIGKMVDESAQSKAVVRMIAADGNSIGNHSYTHEYQINMANSLFPGNKMDVARVMNEFDETNKAIGNALGRKFTTRIFRLPGGYVSRVYYKDPNLPQFNAAIKARGIYCIDWTLDDRDSEGRPLNSDQIFQNVKNGVGNNEKVVILMHDTYGKEQTAKALPQIIDYLKGQGYEFKTIV